MIQGKLGGGGYTCILSSTLKNLFIILVYCKDPNTNVLCVFTAIKWEIIVCFYNSKWESRHQERDLYNPCYIAWPQAQVSSVFTVIKVGIFPLPRKGPKTPRNDTPHLCLLQVPLTCSVYTTMCGFSSPGNGKTPNYYIYRDQLHS